MNTSDPFEELLRVLEPMMLPEIEAKEVTLSGVRRVTLSRALADGTSRYIELKYVPPDPGETPPFNMYAAIYGTFGDTNAALNFDARSWGDMSHIAELTRSFIVDLASPTAVPRFEPPEGMFRA